MIDSLRLFRFLILADPVLSIMAALAGLTITDSVEPPTNSAEPTVLFMVLGSLVFVLWVVALVGLWRFRVWARPLYLIVTGLSLGLYLIPPYEPSSGLGDFLTGLTWAVTGALMALMYYSPVAERFALRSAPSSNSQ
jgi:hypothetical protein